MRKTAAGVIAVFVLAVLAVPAFFTGCTEKNVRWTPGKPFPKERIKIGIIHPNEINETSLYDWAHYEGTVEMQKTLGLGDDQIIRRVNVFEEDQAETEAVVRECISEGAVIIIAPSYGYMEPCEKLAAEFPGVIFAHATGYKHNDRNFTNYSGRVYQARYLSGIVAGLKTESGKIGFVAAMGRDNSEVSGSVNAFALGVESVNPGARIYVKVTYSWFDPLGEGEAAKALIAEGCDVIAQHTNTTVPQLAARNAGVWGIGFNGDMGAYVPGTVLTSVVLRWGAYYCHLVQSVIDGTFSPAPYFGGIAEGVVDITPPALTGPETAAAVEAARREIREGRFNVFDGELETSGGGIIGVKGETLSDSEIIGNIHWYYRNVVEL
ncbi:MAG: BMP family ABC transporter substrate-binding protein [Treponema sp.]|jgi:basic membrane protein A|nr:BMP family ABC transporter substrate-binding protein [Treponema sp.]